MTPRPDIPSPEPADCSAFEEVVQQLLDGTTSPAALAPAHLTDCPRCARLAASARTLVAGLAGRALPPAPPPGFADRVVREALRERRLRKYRRVGAGLAVAAGLLAFAVAVRPTTAPVPDTSSRLAEGPTVPPPRLDEQFAEAGSALAALTRRTAGELKVPAPKLSFTAESVAPTPRIDLAPEAESAIQTLAAMPKSAQTAFAPVASTTRRAVTVFLRDTGLGDPVPGTN